MIALCDKFILPEVGRLSTPFRADSKESLFIFFMRSQVFLGRLQTARKWP